MHKAYCIRIRAVIYFKINIVHQTPPIFSQWKIISPGLSFYPFNLISLFSSLVSLYRPIIFVMSGLIPKQPTNAQWKPIRRVRWSALCIVLNDRRQVGWHAGWAGPVISQRGSAWHCSIGRWLSKGKHAFFYLSAWKNQWKFRNHFWHTWLRWGDLQTHQIWSESVYNERRYTVVKYNGFVTFVLPFFRFLISPTGRNSGPIRTFNSSNDVFCPVHVPFFRGGGVGAFKFISKGYPVQKKTSKLRPVFGLDRFAAKIVSFMLRARAEVPYSESLL